MDEVEAKLRRRLLASALVLLAGCSSGTGTVGSPGGGSSAQVTSPPRVATPLDPQVFAGRLTQTTTDLEAAIRRWVDAGGTSSWPPPDDVVLLALDQQRLYQQLALRPALLGPVLAALPGPLRADAADIATAGARLVSGITPATHPPNLRTRAPPPADTLLAYYREAEARFGVDWTVLAAVNFVESRFGRVTSASSAGARGPMQFLPATWKAYGLGGDVHDPHDAILGAANYLHASGAPGDDRRAVYAYNPVHYYVAAVLAYARAMRRDVVNFYALYNWQVFALTAAGPVQLTGPGSS